MRYGVCTWIYGDEPLEETATRLAAQGYDGVELPGDPSDLSPSGRSLTRYQPAEVRCTLARHGLAVLSITPANEDLAHPEPAVRGRALDYYLRLLDFAVAVGSPIVSCHGAVGRVRAVGQSELGGTEGVSASPRHRVTPSSPQTEEYALFVQAVGILAHRAESLGLIIALECLNRYESHLLNTSEQALQCVRDVGSPAVGLLLDAYHMNIEEADLAGAIRAAGSRLALFHAADSNRQAVGRGHTDFVALFRALRDIGYDGSVIVECTAAGPDPFTPIKGPGWREEVACYTAESLQRLRAYAETA